MQVQAFRKVHGYPFASTMCIGNLRSGMDALVAFGHTHDKNALWKSLHYFAIIFIFALGAGIGTQCVGIFGERTIWLSCALLLVSLCFMFIKEDLPEIEDELKNNASSCRNGCRGRTYPPGNTVAAVRPAEGQDPSLRFPFLIIPLLQL